MIRCGEMTSVPTSEIERAATVLGPHATLRTVASAVGMEITALRERCLNEGIRLLGFGERAAAGGHPPSDRDPGTTSTA